MLASYKTVLNSNYSKIPYDTHAINVYDTIQQGTDECTEAYLHRVQYVLECIHHTNDMSSISAICTNYAKILTGLRDDKLCNKLAESKSKKGPTWCRFCRTLQTWLSTLKGPEATLYHLLKSTTHHLIRITVQVTFTGPTNSLQKRHNTLP